MTQAISAEEISRSVKWVAFVKLISQAGTFITTVFALKYLTQEQYGLASMAFIFMGVLDTLIDFGFGAALIQKEDLTDDECSSVFWLLAICSVAFIGLTWLTADLAGWFFHEQRVVEIIRVLSFSFLATPIQIVYRSRLTRVLRLDLLAKCDFLGLVLRSSITLATAAMGFGIWCLIIGFIAEKIIIAIVIAVADSWIPSRHFKMASIRTLVYFGLKITGDRVLYFLLYRMDAILVGKFLGAEILGLYSYAQQFVGAVLQIIMTTGVKIAYPLFSRYQNSETLLPLLYKSERLVALVSFPALIGMALIADDLVLATVGPAWAKSALYIQVLAIAGLFQMTAALLPQLLNAVNRTDINLKINSLSTVLYFGLLSILMHFFGENGLFIAIIGFQLLRYALILSVCLSILPIRVYSIAKVWMEAGLSTTCMLIAVVVVQSIATPPYPLLRIGIYIGIAVLTYCLINLLLFRDESIKIYRLLRQS